MTVDDVAAYLKTRDNYVIVSHDGPDADGLGAAYALALTLAAIGKTAVAVVPGGLPPKFRFIDRRGLFAASGAGPEAGGELPFPAAKAAPIVVDTHDAAYLPEASAALVSAAGSFLVIDHHEPREGIGEPALLDPTASSSCELVYGVARRLGVELPLDAAEAVYAGIIYDTGSFAYPKTSERTFSCALELVRRGVSPYEIHRRMYESSCDGALLLQKAAISSLELRLEGRVALLSLKKEDLVSSGASYEDAEDLVNIPLQDRRVEVSALFKENLEGRLRCSLRSKGGVNVAHVAQAFGGGGHRTAAGFTCTLPLAAAMDNVVQSIARALAS
jgi:phosphoesterase RecJ-like protein